MHVSLRYYFNSKTWMSLPGIRRKSSLSSTTTADYNPYRRTLKPQPIPQKRIAGKINRNNISRSRRKEGENAIPSYASVASTKQDLLARVKHSQMGSHPCQPITVLSEMAAVSKLNAGYGASSHHESKYDQVIAQFEKKKQQIDRQLGNLKQQQSISVSLGASWRKERHANIHREGDTPKFASSGGQKGDFVRRQYRSVSSVMDGKSRKEKRGEKDQRVGLFIAGLKRQIELEENLRNAKLSISKEDMKEVSRVTRNEYGLSEIAITLEADEFDPFFRGETGLGAKEQARRVFECHREAETHWKTQMQGCYQEEVLNSVYDCFEGSQKGVVSLKGMVRELGVLMQNERYYRGRDLYRIHKKLSPMTRDRFIRELGLPHRRELREEQRE